MCRFDADFGFLDDRSIVRRALAHRLEAVDFGRPLFKRFLVIFPEPFKRYGLVRNSGSHVYKTRFQAERFSGAREIDEPKQPMA